ncbi:phenylalanine--tRNA ligase subunit beta [Ectothiorhodospiraceae bacterium WFHF3C12]|nr:phenylalanine--tRNA ligase subunit beta [Ectothiorhodospiraceae bacterium WFHF3C12]
MRISEAWLREWVAVPASTQELADRLSMAGLEVDAVEPAAPEFSGVVIGQIVDCEPHPDADRLQVCRVSDGTNMHQVVCGAPNARPDMLAPFALVGAELPGGLTIKQAKLRGVESQGMLCSAKELGISEDAAGLMELPPSAQVGEKLRAFLGLNDQVVEVDLTPNRGDCLGMSGVAREVGVLFRSHVQGPEITPVPAVSERTFPVELQAPEGCPRYVGRVIEGIDPNAPTPVWIQERLRRAGVRPHSAAVDVTNYVMLELGQPMHAFDLDKLSGGIRVRQAEAGEKLTLIGGEEVVLSPQTLVIADHQRPVAMAGVMGGADTAVSGATRNVFLESAFFSPLTIIGRAREYGLHTDSSHRFERGVDSQLQARAMERATDLLTTIAGGKAGPLTEAVAAEHMPKPATIALRLSRIVRLLGLEIPDHEVVNILERLGMEVTGNGQGWSVTAPSWRFDITREVDLIEELARVWGYDRLPTRRPPIAPVMTGAPERRLSDDRLRAALVERGYFEAITYSFVEPDLQASLGPEPEPLALANPISADMSVMRTNLWPGLVQALRRNRHRQFARVRLFEIGLSFRPDGDDLHQRKCLAGVAFGAVTPEQWDLPRREVDFYDVKGDLEALFAATGAADAFTFRAESHPALHAGQSARIHRDGEAVGWLGAMDPGLQRELDIDGRVYLFEIDADALRDARLPAFSELSKYPSIRRDLAVVVDEEISAAAVRECVRESAGELLQELVVFDLYRGKGIPNGRKSLAIGLILQESSRTLTDKDVEEVVERVVGRLRHDLRATLRE